MKGVAPFPAVPVTPDQARCYERQVQQVLDETLCAFDTHVAAREKGTNLLLNKWQWKPLKTLDGLNSYKERQPTHPELTDAASCSSQSSFGSMSGIPAVEQLSKPTKAVAMAAYTPEMAPSTSSAVMTGSSSIASLAIEGHLKGSLSDVMYGLLATDTAELHLRHCYMTDPGALDTTMIDSIQRPNATDPFHFRGLQWIVRGEASRVKTKARRPRDFVLLVASGVVHHKVPGQAQRQEIGYALCQSIERQECGELETRGLTRGWLSTCSLFTAVDGSSALVDVYARGYVDFRGKMQDYQAASMMNTYMLAGLTDAAACGQSKKLSWLLTYKDAATAFRHPQSETGTTSSRCAICERKFGVLSSAMSCDLCQIKMCSRCRVSRVLRLVKRPDAASGTITSTSKGGDHQASGRLHSLPVRLCKNCKMNASHMDARVMARREVEAGCDSNETADTASEDDGSTPVQSSSSLFSCSQSRSEDSFSGDSSMRSSATDTAQLRGRPSHGAACLRGSCGDKHLDDVVKTKVMLSRMDSSKSSCSDFAYNSFASTQRVSEDQDQEELSRELTTTSSFELQHQSLYGDEDPEMTYAHSHQSRTSTGNAHVDLLRRMQELQMNAESVYRFTSKMNASTRYRHEQVVSRHSSLSISELD
uniref:FYVE-type domain-containing protein n=1 Tax=Peronospora matthiolae TaxID=2874970 RepID=A0AAV1U0C2_9STRA